MLGEHREGYQHLIGMQTRILALQVFCLGFLNRFNHALRNEFQFMIDTSQMFGDIQQKSSAATKQRCCLRGDNGAVFQFDGGSIMSCFDFLFVGSCCRATIGCSDFRLIEQQAYLFDFVFVIVTVSQFVRRCVIATDDFIAGSLTTHLIIADAEAYHIDTHIDRKSTV